MTFKYETIAAGTAGEHFNNVSMASVLSKARGAHLLSIGLSYEEVISPEALPYVSEVLIRYRAPVKAGQALVCAVRAVSRGRTSFVVEQSVTADGEVAATCRAIQVFVNGATGQPVPIPPRVLAGLEAAEGGPLPPTPRADELSRTGERAR